MACLELLAAQVAGQRASVSTRCTASISTFCCFQSLFASPHVTWRERQLLDRYQVHTTCQACSFRNGRVTACIYPTFSASALPQELTWIGRVQTSPATSPPLSRILTRFRTADIDKALPRRKRCHIAIPVILARDCLVRRSIIQGAVLGGR